MLQEVRILLSGASGFIGKSLSVFLESFGFEVVALPREGLSSYEGFDAVIHLAGEPLTLSRWSASKKEKIFSSRVLKTRFLSEVFSKQIRPPRVFICASAVGYYGDQGEKTLTEENPPGDSFLSHVCTEWEKACQPMKDRGIQVVNTRFGIVIGQGGGILQKMLTPYKLGLGGKVGNGEQWISWIALEDLQRAIYHVLQTPSILGPVNFVSPVPVRQKEFSHLLAHLLHRPTFFHLPAWFIKGVYGDAGKELLLASAKALPAKLLSAGFTFKFPELQDALQKALS